MLSGMLFRHRLRYRLHKFNELIRLTVDFWVSLYIIIPGLVLAVSTYINLLRSLPGWYSPNFQVLWLVLIAFLVTLGTPRSYLSRADLIFVHDNKPDFKRLVFYGQISSTILKSLLLIIVFILAYPFYKHIQNVNLIDWLSIGLWVLFIKVIILLINWRLSIRFSAITYKFIHAFAFFIFICSWFNVVTPFLQNPSSSLWLAFSGIIWLIASIIVIHFLPIKNWETVAVIEEHCDLDMIGMFLGYQAQIPLAGKSGTVRWGRSRWGIAFNKKTTFTYFFVKYFMRKRGLWKLLGQFYLLAGFMSFQTAPFWFHVVFAGGILTAMGFLLSVILQEHSQDLYLRMLPVQWEDLHYGISRIFLLLLIPFSVLFILVPITGNSSWVEGLLGAVILFISALALSRKLSARVAVFFNYDQSKLMK